MTTTIHRIPHGDGNDEIVKTGGSMTALKFDLDECIGMHQVCSGIEAAP
jgi:hypothetical protein